MLRMKEKLASIFNMTLVLVFLLQLSFPIGMYVLADDNDIDNTPVSEEVMKAESLSESKEVNDAETDGIENQADSVNDGDSKSDQSSEKESEIDESAVDIAEDDVETPPETDTVNQSEKDVSEDNEIEESDVEEIETENVSEDASEFEEEIEETITLSFEADGVRVEVFGEAGVIPAGTQLSLEPLTEAETDLYLNAIEENTDVLMGYVSLFNIHLLDEAGNKIQPNGEVSVRFFGLNQIKSTDDVFVYHVESTIAQKGTQRTTSSTNVILEDFVPTVESNKVSFTTDHFSIYILGTNIRHDSTNNRYEMYVGETVELETNRNDGSWSTSSGSASINANGSQATVTPTGPGNITIRYGYSIFIWSDYSYFYIEAKQRDTNDTLTPAVPPVTDPDALPPGTVAAEKTARWVDYNNRIAEINLTVEGMPIVSGSDVILVMDVSGSMSTSNRIGTAQQASNEFITDLLGDGNPLNNRVAFIPFHGSSGGTGETNSVTYGSHNFSYNANELANYVNQTYANGGTNYTAAMNKAINYANSRPQSERDRPLYVVFMSDGAPGRSGNSPDSANWNGINQASTLKGMGVTIYTIGIQLSGSAPGPLQNLSSTLNGQLLYQNVSNMNQLVPVLETIAGEIKIAGTQAVFKDYLSEYFNFYNQAPYNTGDGNYSNGAVTIQVGNITETVKTYKIFVQLKPEYRLQEDDYPTNTDIHLDYKDVDNQNAHKDKDEIGHPHLSVGYGTINVRYVLVNEAGQYITRDTGVVVDPQFRQYVPSQNYAHLFEYNGDTHLEVMENYTVSPSVPSGYTLYVAGETINQEVTWANTNPTVEFRVVRAPIAHDDVVATKNWVNGENVRPEKWFYQLRRTVTINGNVIDEPVAVQEISTAGDTVTVTFSDIEQTDSNYNAYTFYVKEGTYVDGVFTEAVPENFTKSGTGLELTNTYQIPTDGTASATKIWAGGTESDQVAVDLTLWRTVDGINFTEIQHPNVVVTPATAGAASYAYEWSQLEETNAAGETYTYYFTEDIIPDGFDRIYSADAIEVGGIEYEPSGGTVINRRLTIDFSFTKVGEAGDELVGSEFTLEREGDGELIANTGTDPEFIFAGLKEGKYILTEVTAPPGYKLPPSNWTIEVVRNEESGALEIVIPNDSYFSVIAGSYLLKNETQGVFPQTGGMGVVSYIVVGLLAIMSGIGLYVQKNIDGGHKNEK